MKNKRNKKKLGMLASSSLLLGALASLSVGANSAQAFTFNPLGTGAEVRAALGNMNTPKAPAELKCASKSEDDKKNSKDAKTTKKSEEAKATKTSEAKCGEGKCGEGKCGSKDTDQKADAKDAKQSSKATDKKADAKSADASKTSEDKTTEAKCGEGKCGS